MNIKRKYESIQADRAREAPYLEVGDLEVTGERLVGSMGRYLDNASQGQRS